MPQLQSNLREEKLRGLERASEQYSDALARVIGSNASESQVNHAVRAAADAAGGRVTLLGVSRGTQGLQLFPISDSTDEIDLDELGFRTAEEAARTGRTVTGTEATNRGRVGEAARPIFFNDRVTHVAVYSQRLTDVAANVALIRRRIVIAGLGALAFALAAGYLVAGALSRRVKRLERAAEQVAGGDFSHSIPVDSDDELGQLAVAFNDMQRQLARLDDARKQFIAVASHELRTPIFSLGGFVELLEDEELDEETRARFVVQMRAQVERLHKLATELLDLSRLEAGSLELSAEPVDVAVLARGVADEFEPALVRHESRLSLDLPADLPAAHCDRDRTAQIIRILLDNAIVHTPRGTDIALSAQQRNGGVALAVADSGRGIRRDARAHIFEPFYTSDEAHGSGLGLAIASELAQRMAGRLGVESRPGSTTFTLQLPA